MEHLMVSMMLALLALLRGADAEPGIGYALEFGAHAETSSPKTRLDGLDGLQSLGWTISAWLKYADLSGSVYMTDVSLVSSADGNLMNGFGGPGANTFAFSNGVSYSGFLPTADYATWHHFAMSFDFPTATVTQFVDGTNVKQWSVSSYSFLETWANDTALNLGLMCYHGAEGTARECMTNRFFMGQMDDVAFFVGALSDAELAERWNSSLTQRLVDGLEPSLAIFYDFNDPLSSPGETANLGYAGADYDLVHGRLDMTKTGTLYLSTDLTREGVLASPNVVPSAQIARKAAEPNSTPHVTYAAPGATIDLAAVLGMASGQIYTTPVPFNATTVLLDVPTAKGGTAIVHLVPFEAPAPPEARWCSVSTSEDVPLMMQLLSGKGHTWNEATLRVLARPPTRGVLYQQERKEGRSLARPVTKAGDLFELSANVLYVPEKNAFGDPFDSFLVFFRLNGTNDGGGPDGVYESEPFNMTISISPLDDIPTVRDWSLRIDEDSASVGLESGHEIMLELSDSELGQVLAGHITRLPSQGTLFTVNSSGHRTPIDAEYNPFDIGSPVLRQYLSRVVAVSSFWGSNPPYSGYHPLGILGVPDCENNLESSECSPDQAWVSDLTRFPELGTHVLLNSHTAYVRAVHEVGSAIGGTEGALDLEMHQARRGPDAISLQTNCPSTLARPLQSASAEPVSPPTVLQVECFRRLWQLAAVLHGPARNDHDVPLGLPEQDGGRRPERRVWPSCVAHCQSLRHHPHVGCNLVPRAEGLRGRRADGRRWQVWATVRVLAPSVRPLPRLPAVHRVHRGRSGHPCLHLRHCDWDASRCRLDRRNPRAKPVSRGGLGRGVGANVRGQPAAGARQ